MSDNIYQRYFMFSASHYIKIKETEAKNGNKDYKFGTVIVNGYPKIYTKCTKNPKSYTDVYSDAKILVSGDMRKIRYSDPE